MRAEWRRLHNEELHDLYFSVNIIWVIKTRMRWAGHVARKGIGQLNTRFWWGNLNERDHLKTPGTDGRKIVKKWDGGAWTGLT
jgi:hypothetical protein